MKAIMNNLINNNIVESSIANVSELEAVQQNLEYSLNNYKPLPPTQTNNFKDLLNGFSQLFPFREERRRNYKRILFRAFYHKNKSLFFNESKLLC